MLSTLAVPVLAVMSALSTMTPQDAQEILQTAREMQTSRFQGIENYTVDQTMSGNRILIYYERIPDTDLFRMVPVGEVSRAGTGFTEADGQMMAGGMAMALRMAGPALASAAPAGPGALAMDNMMGEMIEFLDAGAAYQENDGVADAESADHDMRNFANVAELVGREMVGGQECFHLRADNLGLGQVTEEGHEFELASVSLWIDTEFYLTRRLLMEGTLTTDGNSSVLTIEKLDQDYGVYGDMGVLMYSPKTQIMRLTGLMGGLSDKEQRELEEAREKLAEFETQLASMPPSQKQMIEDRMAGQLAQMRQFIAGEGVETVVVLNGIKLNEGPPSGLEMGKAITGGTP